MGDWEDSWTLFISVTSFYNLIIWGPEGENDLSKVTVKLLIELRVKPRSFDL